MAELTIPTLGPEILAKRDGECHRCHEPIVAGESYIRKVVNLDRWMHALCAADYKLTLEAELGEDVECSEDLDAAA